MAPPLVFLERDLRYRIGTGILLLGTVLAIFGVVSPGWYGIAHVRSGASGYSHLWIICKDGLYYCNVIGAEWTEGFEKATMAFVVIGLLLLLAACLLGVHLNFVTPSRAHNRWLEISTLVGGGFIFLGAIIFVAAGSKRISNSPRDIGLSPSSDLNPSPWAVYDLSFGYALVLTFVAAILITVAGVLIFIFNRPLEVPSDVRTLSTLRNNDPVDRLHDDIDDVEGGFQTAQLTVPSSDTPTNHSSPPDYESWIRDQPNANAQRGQQQPRFRIQSRDRDVAPSRGFAHGHIPGGRAQNHVTGDFDDVRRDFEDAHGDLGLPSENPRYGLSNQAYVPDPSDETDHHHHHHHPSRSTNTRSYPHPADEALFPNTNQTYLTDTPAENVQQSNRSNNYSPMRFPSDLDDHEYEVLRREPVSNSFSPTVPSTQLSGGRDGTKIVDDRNYVNFTTPIENRNSEGIVNDGNYVNCSTPIEDRNPEEDERSSQDDSAEEGDSVNQSHFGTERLRVKLPEFTNQPRQLNDDARQNRNGDVSVAPGFRQLPRQLSREGESDVSDDADDRSRYENRPLHVNDTSASPRHLVDSRDIRDHPRHFSDTSYNPDYPAHNQKHPRHYSDRETVDSHVHGAQRRHQQRPRYFSSDDAVSSTRNRPQRRGFERSTSADHYVRRHDDPRVRDDVHRHNDARGRDDVNGRNGVRGRTPRHFDNALHLDLVRETTEERRFQQGRHNDYDDDDDINSIDIDVPYGVPPPAYSTTQV